MIVHLEISVSNRTGFSCPAGQRDRCLFTGQAQNFATWWDSDGLSRLVHRVQIRLVFLQFSSKLLKKFFGESCLMSAFTKIFFWEVEDDKNRPRGRWKRSSIFQMSHPSQKVCSQMIWACQKKFRFVRSFTKKKFRKFWWKLKKWQMFF